jgi:hypothetical protein
MYDTVLFETTNYLEMELNGVSSWTRFTIVTLIAGDKFFKPGILGIIGQALLI